MTTYNSNAQLQDDLRRWTFPEEDRHLFPTTLGTAVPSAGSVQPILFAWSNTAGVTNANRSEDLRSHPTPDL